MRIQTPVRGMPVRFGEDATKDPSAELKQLLAESGDKLEVLAKKAEVLKGDEKNTGGAKIESKWLADLCHHIGSALKLFAKGVEVHQKGIPAVTTAPTKTDTASKLDGLRKTLTAQNLDAFIVPSSDEHLNEYLPEGNKRREYMSNFTGSAGDFLVTQKDAWLFADSRYHEQADLEVDLKHVSVSKLGLENQPTLTEKITEMARNKTGLRIGYDPFTLSLNQTHAYEKALAPFDAKLIPLDTNPIDGLWDNRPAPLNSQVFSLNDTITGETATAKLKRVQAEVAKTGAEILPVTMLDQVSWLFNLRGKDVSYNPVFLAYAIVTPKNSYLFTETSRIKAEDKAALEKITTLLPYEDYAPTLSRIVKDRKALIDTGATTAGTEQLVKAANGKVITGSNPITIMKAVKNAKEIEGMKTANLKASVGKVRALKWLDDQMKAGNTVTEESFRQALEKFYKEDPDYFDLSFNTIAGAGANSSIVHYGTPDPKKALDKGHFFLIDSGVQYLSKDWAGTTDDTRTVIVGDADAERKKKFTAVLKAHIDGARQVFPRGVEGARIDGIVRASMWQNGLDFGHGTGHGVGAFLNVHEGPNGIRSNASAPFQPGMITSDEPGYYKSGWGGIRCENLVLTVDTGKKSEPDGHPMYGFEPITFIPFDKKLTNHHELSAEQGAWLKNYHQQVYDKVSPFLNDSEKAWLKDACS